MLLGVLDDPRLSMLYLNPCKHLQALTSRSLKPQTPQHPSALKTVAPGRAYDARGDGDRHGRRFRVVPSVSHEALFFYEPLFGGSEGGVAFKPSSQNPSELNKHGWRGVLPCHYGSGYRFQTTASALLGLEGVLQLRSGKRVRSGMDYPPSET